MQVRIKNRLAEKYDGTETAGYRNVVVNMRIDVDLTRLLGIEGYVCEVQLVLKEFYMDPTSSEVLPFPMPVR